MKKYNQRSSEYQNCLIGREYSPTLVKKQFEEVGRMTKIQAKRKTKSGKKNQFFYQLQSKFTLHEHSY